MNNLFFYCVGCAILYSLLLLFIWIMPKRTFLMTNSFPSHFLFVILAFLCIGLLLYPYWFLGDMSAVGWLDEIRGTIPWHYSVKNLNYGDFNHQFAGGAGVVFGYGYEHFSVYRWLLSFCDIYSTNLVIRLFSLMSLFMGIYLVISNCLKANLFLSFSLALFSVVVHESAYGWTIGGMGWDFSIAVWLTLACLGNFNKMVTNYLIGFTTVLLGSTLSQPVFVFYLIGFTVLFVLFLMPNFITVVKARYKLWFTLMIFTIAVFLVNSSAIYYPVLGAVDFSTRLLGTFARTHPEVDFITDFLFHLERAIRSLLYVRDYAHIKTFLFPVAVFAVLICVLKLRFKPLIVIFLLIILFPIVVQAAARAIDVPVVASYQWTIIWTMNSVFTAFVMASAATEKSGWTYLRFVKPLQKHDALIRGVGFCTNAVIFIGLLWFGWKGGVFLTQISVSYTQKYNSFAFLEHYSVLRELPHEYFRTVTDSKTITWATPIYFDMDTFDGLQPAFPARRTYFLAYGVERKKLPYYPKSHFFNFYQDKASYDLNMLALANVRFMLTGDEAIRTMTNMSLVLSIPSLTLDGDFTSAELFTNYITESHAGLNLVKGLRVFELQTPWHRVFIPKAIAESDHSYKTVDFYEELREVQYHAVIIAQEDRWQSFNNSEVLLYGFELTNSGVNISVNEAPGAVVYNQVYTPYWSAFCEDKKLPITPVNGIMMMVNKPIGCKTLKFVHRLQR